MLQVTEKIKNRTYEISLQSTGIVVGLFVNFDGFFYYEPSKDRTWGFWSHEFLKSVSTEIEILNKPINDTFNERK